MQTQRTCYQICRRMGTLLWVGLLTLWFTAPGASAQGVVALRGATIETASDKGTIENGTILIRDGRIVEVGTEVDIPVTARVVDVHGKTVLPGFVDPYYVVSIVGQSSQASFREVVFRGRVFRVPNSNSAAPTSFTRITDGFDPKSEDWWDATRSGITTAHLVASGVGESAIATVLPEEPTRAVTDREGGLFLALTNQSASLNVLRKGLTDPKDGKGGENGGDRAAMAARMARMRQMAAARGGAPSRGPSGSSQGDGNGAPQSLEDKLWSAVREGKQPLFVNVNNAASILYLLQTLDDSEKAKLALVAGGDDLIRTIDALNAKRVTVVMPPRIDLIPNSQNRVNVARLLQDQKVRVAFSLSLNQSDYRNTQDSPLFPVAMLVRSGLDRQTAIRALTRVPAELMGLEKEVGSIAPGLRANLVVFDEDPFAATASIEQVLVDGRPIYEN